MATDMKGILIFGANGSGKSTLGRLLSHRLNYKHLDIEPYYFPKATIPYSVSRTKDEVVQLLLADMERYERFILSAVTGDYGDAICSKYDLAIRLSAPREIRLDRIRQRAIDQYGDRVLEGGDMYDRNNQFIDFAANRSLAVIDQFAKGLTCPIVDLDSTKPIDELAGEAEAIIEKAKRL